uniref:synaptic vesicle glycoprotein 2B-like isoform X1 n=1 Tax=Osmia lignaria TaxID=473952 RepID=UPI00147807BD|nr:synaptic vesicle glycoprotein 2B-like isoform X1 [Osmia lignaria]
MTNDCETIIAKTGWGICHYSIIGICGLCKFAEACVLSIILVVVPLLACDLSLPTGQAIAVHAVLTFGMVIGAFLFGAIIDAYGRKRSISLTLIVIFCSMITLSFAQATFLINLSLFILGTGLAGNDVVLKVYLIELLPMKQRGSSLAVLDIFGIIGYIAALGFSWLLMPSILRFQDNKFRPNSWRILAGIGGVPNLIMACAVSLLPASPRYMLYRQRQEETLAILQQMYAINTSKHANTYPSSNFDNCVRSDEWNEIEKNGIFKTIEIFCLKTCKRVGNIFETPFARITILAIIISCLQFPGIAWFALWKTQLLEGMENLDKSKENNCTIDIQNMVMGFLHNCQEINIDRFELLLYLSLSYILAEILLVIGIDSVGRKIFLVFSGLIGAATCLALVFTVHHVMQLVLSMTTLATYAICNTSTTILILENYFTGIRGTAIGFTRILPHLLDFFTKLFLNVHCFHSIFFVSGMLLSVAVVGLQMPDLTRLPMQE